MFAILLRVSKKHEKTPLLVTLDGRNRAIAIAESLARLIAAIRST